MADRSANTARLNSKYFNKETDMSALHSLSSKQHYDTEGIFQIYKKIDKKTLKILRL